MAQKRMFSIKVVDTDKFLEMPASAQALYFHLGMHGDDDGFVASPKKIARAVGCNDDDMRLLAAKGFIIPFDSGVIVITDWWINNTLKNDRYQETIYTEERDTLLLDEARRYACVPSCFQNGTIMEPQQNIVEPNQTKSNQVKGNTVGGKRVAGENPSDQPLMDFEQLRQQKLKMLLDDH